MIDDGVDLKRRRLLTGVTTGVGLVGAVAAAVPFVASMTPSARARAAGAPVEVDISKLEQGQMLTVEWRGKPVWILNRTTSMLDTLGAIDSILSDPNSDVPQQPEYARNEHRSVKTEVLVLIGICTHLGCSPKAALVGGADAVLGLEADWPGGFFCPCHGSKFDLAGRVYKGVPAPTNMVVPPYHYLSDSRIVIGLGPEEGEA